jgi:phosphonate transport system ATP-binding protein
LGPSGSGKTTLLRTVNRLVEPSSGSVLIDGIVINQENQQELRSKIGMIFQHFNLVGNLSAQNNVLTGLLNKKSSLSTLFYLFNRQQKLLALEALDQVGLLSKAFTRTDQLSGGQQQRVGIARAIVKKPLLILADEPVASLDPMISFQVLSLLKEISLSQGITVLCNLHQVDFALRFADRIIGLAEGRIIMDKPIKEIDGEYIQNIYKGHNQGLFFGLQENQSGINDILSYKT